jgi:hypothetical protein
VQQPDAGKDRRMSIGFVSGHPPSLRSPTGKWVGLTLTSVVVWAAVYSQLAAFSDWVVASTQVNPASRLGEAIAFFAYGAPKVVMLLGIIVFGWA